MSITLPISNLGNIKLDKLSKELCVTYCEELLNLINIIPFTSWTREDLIEHDNDYFKNKFNYSYVIKDCNDKIIGVLISYFRLADKKHIFDSLYIHKFAISPLYQNKGIGTAVLQMFIKKSFEEIPWLLNITIQTNDTYKNNYVIKFYRNIGFKDMYNISYPNKTDILFLYERESLLITTKYENSINLPHPHIKDFIDLDKKIYILPKIYFSSTNQRKKEIVKFIFNNYNIDVIFVKYKAELTEPQIESPDLEEEKKLVSLPLKSFSRFISREKVPFIIEDTMLFIEFFNRNGKQWELPGLDTKRWLRQMGLDGILEIMGNTGTRKAKFVSQTGAYLRANNYCFGRGEVNGKIANYKSEIITPKYGTYPYFFHLIFIPEGASKTLAEMDMFEYAQYDYMRKSIRMLIDEISDKDPQKRQMTMFD